MAHYLFFSSLVNQYIFYYAACLFAKVSKVNLDSGHFKNIYLTSMFTLFQYPVLNWFCVKYNYHFKITISITSAMSTLSPIIYFYSIARPGGKKHVNYCVFLAPLIPMLAQENSTLNWSSNGNQQWWYSWLLDKCLTLLCSLLIYHEKITIGRFPW